MMVSGRLLNQWRFRRCILITLTVSALVVIYVHVRNGAWVKNFLRQDTMITNRPDSPLARDKLRIIKETVIIKERADQTSTAAVFAQGNSKIKISNELKEFFKPFDAKNNIKQTQLTQNAPINEEKLDRSKDMHINTGANQEIKTEGRKDAKIEVSKDIAAISDKSKMLKNNKLFDKRSEPVIKTINRAGNFDIDPWLKVPYIAPAEMLNATKLSKKDYHKERSKKSRTIPRPIPKTMSPMLVQGVRQGPLVRTQMRIPLNLTTEVFIFEVMRESREERHSVKDNKCVMLKSYFVSSPICVHDPNEDEVISATLMKQQTWEPNLLYVAGRILTNNIELKFLDLGCNLGVYTILAARLGINVIAVDPSKQNLRLLTKALSLGGLRNKVTMLWNAVSNVHEKVTLTDIVGNVGGAFVETAESGKSNNANTVQTILLDDLIPFFKDNSVFIKMDVETYEWKVLQGADKFFSTIDVAYVLMEWSYHKEHGDGQEIIDFMYKRGLYPHINANYNTQLDKDEYETWPDNVLWIKYSNILVE